MERAAGLSRSGGKGEEGRWKREIEEGDGRERRRKEMEEGYKGAGGE